MTNLEAVYRDSPAQFVDPVFGMVVDLDRAKLFSTYEGYIYWLCAETCRKAFQDSARKYLKSKRQKMKSWFGRCFYRIANA